MARIRTVKPEHWNDANLPEITLQAHLLWIGLWNFSDDRGIIEYDSYFIKSQIFPRRRDIRVEQIEQWIDQLIKARFLVPFILDGKGYLVSRTFNDHQKIDKPKPSKIPQRIIDIVKNDNSTNIRRSFVDASGIGRPVEYSSVLVNGEERRSSDDGLPPPPPPTKSPDLTEGEHQVPIIEGINLPPHQANLTGPNFDDVHMYFAQNGFQKDFAEKFYNRYEATGWMIGNSKIFNWRAVAQSWFRDPDKFKVTTSGTKPGKMEGNMQTLNKSIILNKKLHESGFNTEDL